MCACEHVGDGEGGGGGRYCLQPFPIQCTYCNLYKGVACHSPLALHGRYSGSYFGCYNDCYSGCTVRVTVSVIDGVTISVSGMLQ